MSHRFVSRVPMFTVEKYNTWKLRMKAELGSIHEDMWRIITDGPHIPMKVNTATNVTETGVDQLIPKELADFTPEDKKLYNLDTVAKGTLYATFDEKTLEKVFHCETSK